MLQHMVRGSNIESHTYQTAHNSYGVAHTPERKEGQEREYPPPTCVSEEVSIRAIFVLSAYLRSAAGRLRGFSGFESAPRCAFDLPLKAGLLFLSLTAGLALRCSPAVPL